MSMKYFVVLPLFIFMADCVKDDYQFVSEVNGYLKLHRIPATWQAARRRCQLEDGLLASPTTPDELTAMKNVMAKSELDPNRVYTGIHATYSPGDYTTLGGTPLSEIDVNWQQGEPNNFENKQNCLILTVLGEFSDVDCESVHPYICYKSKEKMNIHTCGAEYVKSDYIYEDRTGSCYKFHKWGRPWSIAFETCMAEGAYLAIINSNRESGVLSEIFDMYPNNAIPYNIQKETASIGFTRWRELGEFFTIHGTSIVEAGFSTFDRGEPNDVGGHENCGAIHRNGLLNDIDCVTPLTFICEKQPSDEIK